MPKRLRATLLHIVYSKSKKIAIVFIIFLEKSITLSLSSPLLLRISPHTFDFIPIPSMSLSSRKRSIFNAFRHILPCVAPLCEDMHYHKTGVPWQTKSIFNIVFYLLVCSEILCFVNDKNSSKIKIVQFRFLLNITFPINIFYYDISYHFSYFACSFLICIRIRFSLPYKY